MRRTYILLVLISIFFFPNTQFAQTSGDLPVFKYSEPADYEIGGIKVTGAQFSDENAIIAIAGFKVGDKIRIPGGDIPRAMKALWKLRLFTDVQILKEKSIGDVVFLEIVVQERPRLSRYSYKGVKKTHHDDLNERLEAFLLKGGIVTENVKVNASKSIQDFYIEKGYLDAAIKVNEFKDDKATNAVRLEFEVDRKERIKIQDITFNGNENVKDKKLRRLLDGTKRKRKIFSSSKLIQEDYEADKKNIIAYYNTIGFRDAIIANDSIWRDEDGQLMVDMTIDEGNRYFFRDITWKGNSIYDTATLYTVLGIGKGDIYNQELLETRLRFSQDGRDVSTLYMDNGYLFFQVDPIETSIINDSIDLEIRIFEGPQATIDNVTIDGNDRTHEHVIRRELRTRPGQKFSRSDIIRSQREIINLGYFNPEALGINTPVNAQRGTVDIEYTVEEKPSDQLELSAGWGGRGRGVIGTLGVSFNNFSIRNIFNRKAWSPLPQGDGQRLSLRAQTNGRFFQSYNISFTEPWLGGKKPTSFTIAGFLNKSSFGDTGTDTHQQFIIAGGSIGLGTRLRFPDDNFISNTTLNLQVLDLNNWSSGAFVLENGSRVTDGKFFNFSLKQTITRTSVSDPIFPKNGSLISLSGQLTLPYSLFRKTSTDPNATPAEKFKWLEYHKWRFNADWYQQLIGNLVLKASIKVGMIGFYNKNIGTSPFEQFQLGGDGFNNQQFGFTGVDILSLRGYEVQDLEANVSRTNGQTIAAPVFDKFTVELRYPLSLNPSSTIYILAFAQGGNSWRRIREFNPFDIKRSVGMGLRVFLPMFGTLGFDYGIGFDKTNIPDDAKLSNYGQFNIILGFEPE